MGIGDWGDVYHQGDVGEASYAAVPHLVRIYNKQRVAGWNTYAIVALIELARDQAPNPPLPEWMREDYRHAIQELAEIGASEIMKASNPEMVRAILSIIALAKELPLHGKFLVNYSEEEMIDIESRI